jgi:hypothetical protein
MKYRRYVNKQTGEIIQAAYDYARNGYYILKKGEWLGLLEFARKYKVKFI